MPSSRRPTSDSDDEPLPGQSTGQSLEHEIARESAGSTRPERYDWHPPERTGGKVGGVLGKLLLLGILLAAIAVPFTGAGRKIKDGTIQVIQAAKTPKVIEKVVEKERVVIKQAPPEPLPSKFVPSKIIQTAELFNGMQIQTQLQSQAGDLASKERKDAGSYVVNFSVNVKVPRPNQTLQELAELNPDLPKALPGLTAMLPTAQVSGFYHHLYELKQKLVENNLTRLDKALTKHNFFDCETVLQLKHPTTGQKVLMLQGEMDVVSDGSDGDRMSDFDDYIAKSDHFQATTSYFWPKQTTTPNPLTSKFEGRIGDLKKKLDGASTAAKKDIQGDIDYLKRILVDLKSHSYLIAQEDPFVVIPTSMKAYVGFEEYAPAIGDYAVVAYGNKLMPAIVGDYGPAAITGEASLRIARECNGKATPNIRPESDLKVSYFLFPGSAEKPFGPPNYERWRQKCQELIDRIGGVGEGYQLLAWEDRIAKKKAEEAARVAEAKAAADKAAADAKAAAEAKAAQAKAAAENAALNRPAEPKPAAGGGAKGAGGGSR